MKNMLTRPLVALCAVVLIALGGCSTSSTPDVSTIPAPVNLVTPEPAAPAVQDSPTGLDETTQLAILDSVWDDQGADGQAKICYGWGLDPDMMLDQFMSAAAESFDRGVARSFFDGKC